VIIGQVRAPGVYAVDPGLTVLGLFAKAGGSTGAGKASTFTLMKADGREFRLARESRLSTLDIVHGDAIFAQDESWFGRNSQNLTAVSLISSIAIAIVSFVLILTR
jgi:protein involved in polysaccharide export with SLBB domain